MTLTRRDSLKLAGLGAGALLLPGGGVEAAPAVPRYLQQQASTYADDPRQAARAWFAEARSVAGSAPERSDRGELLTGAPHPA